MTTLVLLGAQASAGSRSLLRQVLAELPASVVRGRLKVVMKVNVLSLLGRLRMPVLYPQAAADLLRALPSLQVISLAGPHGLLQAVPMAAAVALLSFLAQR